MKTFCFCKKEVELLKSALYELGSTAEKEYNDLQNHRFEKNGLKPVSVLPFPKKLTRIAELLARLEEE